jgi:glyceraldehyde 3-phosphate dehydrogenase
MKVRVGVNGFGSIGRRFLRIAAHRSEIEVAGVNDLYDVNTRAHLLKYDSNYGTFDKEVSVSGDDLLIDGKPTKMLFEKDPAQLPWGKIGVDVVIECTGRFTDATKARSHIDGGGAKKVVIAAPAKQEDVTLVLGCNQSTYDPERHSVISMASCTTNCLAPVAKVLSDSFGIVKGLMTTVHAYTNDQVVLDFQHKDIRRARAAGLSIIPTTTGAAKAISLVLPELKGKMNGFALRVPTPTVSLVDLVCDLERDVTAEEVNAAFKKASETSMKGILGTSDALLVSVDYKGDPRSSIVDLHSTMVAGGNMVKVVAWYDNEWGYSTRLCDLVSFLNDKGL